MTTSTEATASPLKPSDVFVVGGLPRHTYVPRTELALEDALNSYIEEGHRLLTLTGPTKCGKTVLVKTVVPNGIWISGGSIQTEDDFWNSVLELVKGVSGIQMRHGETQTSGTTRGHAQELSLPQVAKTSRNDNATAQQGRTRETVQTRNVSAKVAALEALRTFDRPLIVDDFHYVPRDLQGPIVRALKQPIFDGLRVIALAVPHRRYDVIRVEREMTGRMIAKNVPLWSVNELVEISEKGFPLLATRVSASTSRNFAEESYGSPHLMQDFCLRLTKIARKKSTDGRLPALIPAPTDRSAFFQEAAKDAAKPTFDRLKIGPRQRSDRKDRDFLDGTSGDIYTAVLLAISLAYTGPNRDHLRYEDIRGSLKDVLAGDIPQAHEVTRVLEKLTEIAKEESETSGGVPVLEWDSETRSLHITDPFFGFYLRWAAQHDVFTASTST